MSVKKFVVTADGIGIWKRGDVISDDDITAKGGTVSRLLLLKGIRETTATESLLSHVDLPDVLKEASFQERQADDKATISRLEGEIRELQNRLQVPVSATEQHASMAALIEVKDKTLANLNAKLAALPELHKEIHDLRKAKEDLEAKNTQLEARLKAGVMQQAPIGDLTNATQPIPAGPDLQANAAAAEKRLKEINAQSMPAIKRGPGRPPGTRVSAEEAQAMGATAQ